MFLTSLKIAEFLVLVAMATSVQKTSASICSLKYDNLTASNGSLKSPNYPSHYPHNTLKVWKITAPKGERIILQFHTFVLESHCEVRCGCDYVKVRNKCTDVTPIDTLCGSIKPLIVTSADNELWIEFRSDHSINKTGFLALYTRASMSCPHPSDIPSKSDYCLQKDQVRCCDRNYVDCRYNKLLTNLNGTITTPGYPSNYPPNTNYRWRITVPQGYLVQINFTKFELQGIGERFRKQGVLIIRGCADCSCDKMRVASSPCDYYGSWMHACGLHNSSLSYISKGRHLFMTFKSDDIINHAGFKAIYRIALPCKGLKPYSCVINGKPSCCSGVEAAVPCSDGHILQRSHCKSGQTCCVVNGTATCCDPAAAAVKCTDRFTEKRSHCPVNKKCCIVDTNKPWCCTGTRLGSWSLMIAMFAVMVLIGITS